MEGRHLVLAYAVVLLLQGGYFAWTAWGYRRIAAVERTLHPAADTGSAKKKATKPV